MENLFDGADSIKPQGLRRLGKDVLAQKYKNTNPARLISSFILPSQVSFLHLTCLLTCHEVIDSLVHLME